MRLGWLVGIGLAISAAAPAPARAQNRHNYDAIEQRHLDDIVQREIDNRLAAAKPAPRRTPLTEAEKRAAAQRADHLTCASRRGRTRTQFEAECGAAAPL
ncbi:hypothetical protein [Phenylobacterium sp.]|uniref:hypothetical protein n=1 Tax=Phenylobacterium sp. TaxID=1871053 RepID=UPI00286C6D47|nr:hypothetical protein [Phenylobacterium sp.]